MFDNYRAHNTSVGLSRAQNGDFEYTAQCDCGYQSSPTLSRDNARERVKTHFTYDRNTRRDEEPWNYGQGGERRR
jgi:hypothetical protein